MQVTLTNKEFGEAVLMWLDSQGFPADKFDITTKVIAGRSDGPLGTRVECQLDLKSADKKAVCTEITAADIPVIEAFAAKAEAIAETPPFDPEVTETYLVELEADIAAIDAQDVAAPVKPRSPFARD